MTSMLPSAYDINISIIFKTLGGLSQWESKCSEGASIKIGMWNILKHICVQTWQVKR